MIAPELSPILLTLAGVQVVRWATSWPQKALVILGLLLAGTAIGLSSDAPFELLGLGVLGCVLWGWLVPLTFAPGSWRKLRTLAALVMLATVLAVQGKASGLAWGDLPQSARDLALVLVLLEPATRVVRLILEFAGSRVNEGNLGAGEIIGALERVIMFLLIMASGYTAIGFIVAAKGLARYEQMKDPDQAEYVLLGTLASVLMVLLAASMRAATT